VVAAGVRQSGRAGDPLAKRCGEISTRLDLTARDHGGRDYDHDEGDERHQPDVLDARRTALPISLSTQPAHLRPPVPVV
jgi:hypothetical protein